MNSEMINGFAVKKVLKCTNYENKTSNSRCTTDVFKIMFISSEVIYSLNFYLVILVFLQERRVHLFSKDVRI